MDQQQIMQYCQKASGYGTKAEPVSWYQNLDSLFLALGSAALAELQKRGQSVAPSMEKYASWIRAQLDSDLGKSLSQMRLHRQEELSDLNYVHQLSENMLGSGRGCLYAEIGTQLPKILAGELDPLVLFGEKQLEEFYQELNGDGQAFPLLAEFVSALVHKEPGMKILEVGAGTGAATQILHDSTLAVKPASPRYSKYDFTDISQPLLKNAKESFQKHKRMQFRVLNIEEDPSKQGFEDGSYDLVIATNVLHATKSLLNTLLNTRKLLKSGGKLILAETTVPQAPRNGFLIALLPAGWLSSEDYRQQSPYISEQKWDEILKQTGFSGTDIVFQDFQTRECHGWSIMVATAISEQTKTSSLNNLSLPNPTIIRGSSSSQRLVDEISHCIQQEGNLVSAVLTLDEAAHLDNHHNNHYIMLCDLEQPLLQQLQPSQFTALQSILSSAGSILWVTKGGGQPLQKPEYGSVQGLCRVSRREHFGVKLVTLALEDFGAELLSQQVKNIVKAFTLSIQRVEDVDLEPEFVEIGGFLHINRVSPADTLNEHIFDRTTSPLRTSEFGAGPPIKMSVANPGLIDSIEFTIDPAPEQPLQQGEVEVEVRAVGANFKDLLTVLGRVDTDKLGCECSGVIRRLGSSCGDFEVGDRVAVCGSDSYRSIARFNWQCVFKIPDSMSFAEAATIPTAFGTAYYCLVEVARMRPGESILIHAASGGTGQAAVQLAIYLGAEIYATVGTIEKKRLLMDVYGLKEDHIFYSRDTSFADGIRRMTNNKGVDVVFNSLSGEGLVASWECIAPYGRFLEIGRRDIDSHGSLPMHPFINNTSFTGVDLTAMVDQRPDLIQKMIHQVMILVAGGTLRPAYPLNVYSISDVELALRTLQSGKSSGKIILEIEKTALVPVSCAPITK
jgi:NADPH:quinone reductase-like Zn-dependent oxidoreductase/ubiquinone/menaquinone biosynthesis C-methylase UbiE